jgi:hypothetical protein
MHRIMAVLAALAVAFSTPAIAQSQQGVTIKSTFCKNLYSGMLSRPPKRAMAVTRDGEKCHAEWGSVSQREADAKALAGCRKSGQKCVLFRV